MKAATKRSCKFWVKPLVVCPKAEPSTGME